MTIGTAQTLTDGLCPMLKEYYEQICEISNMQAFTVDPLVFAMTIFVLASFVGYYVVWKVTPALHTPLMSITNAISAIIIISAMIATTNSIFGLASILGYIATFFASINVFGGFVVTERMLEMFKKKKQKSK